jgi:TRAP-type mannitol/chloroaromatic compound transport system permease large subunit
VPPITLIIAVLGSIFSGIAAPTESAAIGAVGSLLLALLYQRLNWTKSIKNPRMKIISIEIRIKLISLAGKL